MDNLSHSLAGLAAAELIHRRLPAEADPECGRLRRRLLLLSCWLASNFPDLDIILSPLLPAPLGYLLHHRGHTHTLLYALPQALLLIALIWLLWPAARRLLRESTAARSGFLLAVFLGFGLHLLMDFLNSYGIHPFHPFDSRWFYGDMVFILEPVFWVAFGVPLAMMVQRGWMRSLLLALLVAVPLYFTTKGFLLWLSFGTLAALALVLGGLQYRAGARGIRAFVLAFAVALGFSGVQRSASEQARHMVAQAVQRSAPQSSLLDAAMTPFPANPVCWLFVSVESNENAGSYRLRRGQLSLAPSVLPLAACPPGLSEQAASHPERTAAAPANSPADPAAIRFAMEAQGTLDALRTLTENNCHFRAWMRFARMPLLHDSVAEDLRYSANPNGNFTSIDLQAFRDRPCPAHVPAWDFPRADLLNGAGAERTDSAD